MRAVCVDKPGGPENLLLRNIPRPQPKDGEVLIKVHAAALNRADLLQVQYNILSYKVCTVQSNENMLTVPVVHLMTLTENVLSSSDKVNYHDPDYDTQLSSHFLFFIEARTVPTSPR